MAQLFTNLIQRAMTHMGKLAYNTFALTSTDGSPTVKFVSTQLTGANDAYNNGTLLIVRDAAGASAAPEGEFSNVSDWDLATFTGTIDALTSGCGTGDTCMLIKKKYSLAVIRNVTNTILAGLGTVVKVYETLTSNGTTFEFSLPVALKRTDPIDIKYQSSSSDPWKSLGKDSYWVEPGIPGSVSTLSFRSAPPSGTLQVWYYDYHPVVHAFSDPIAENCPIELLALKLASELFAHGRIDDNNRETANRVEAMLAKAEREYKIPRVQPKPKYLTYSQE
jgi:hypothetical protein